MPNIVEENKLIAAGTHFWCHACLGAVSRSKQSPDIRYCQQCYELLTYEASLPKGRDHKPAWIPVKAAAASTAVAAQHNVVNPTAANNRNTTSDITTAKNKGVLVHLHGGGRPKKDVPLDRIKQLRGDGNGVRGIARQLKLSPMTVSRALAGVNH
jgi:hypothetical protein